MIKKDKDPSRKRVLSILRTLLDAPYAYTKKRLAEINGVSHETIKKDFTEFQNAGFALDKDSHFRYAIIPDSSFQKLESLLIFTNNEKELIVKTLENKTPKQRKVKRQIIAKLDNLIRLPRFSNHIFNETYLRKIALLEKAIHDKQKIALKAYRSNHSNASQDRILEAFNIELEDDMLHCFDPEIMKIRHFRISRIEEIKQLNIDWEYEQRQVIMVPDVFRIVNQCQEEVHFTMNMTAYNNLIENYPMAKKHILRNTKKANIYDFKGKVNSKYYGLINFIMGNLENIIEIKKGKGLQKQINNKLEKYLTP